MPNKTLFQTVSEGYGLAMDSGQRWGLELNSVRLLEAVLCADCEVISNSAGESCEICGSRSLLSLGRVLGGSIDGERAILVPNEQQNCHNGFTVLVNPDAAGVLRQRRLRKHHSFEERSAESLKRSLEKL